MPATSSGTTCEALLAWYGENARDLPWRHTHDPYAILVSEVMLQQTQVTRVVPRYLEWLERWPTVEALAAATPADVIQAWSGLGYNRRAVNLHRCARRSPSAAAFRATRASWEAARHRARTPPRRSRASHSAPRSPLPTPTPAACSSAPSPVSTCRSPPGRAYEWNQALFDLGREVCIARTPRCGACPLAAGCPSRGQTYAPLRRQTRFEGSFRQRRARLLREIAAADGLPEADCDAEALVSLVRDGLAEVSDGEARLPGQTSLATSSASPSSERSSASGA